MGDDIRTARDTVGLIRLWFGYFGGATAWSVFHLVSYLWASVVCGTSAEILLNATTVVTAVITAAAGWICYTSWRRLRGTQPTSPGVFRYMLLSGVYLNILFLLTIIASGIAVWVLGTCG